MIAEIALIAGVGAVVYTVADHENVLPWSAMANGSKKWFWEKPPFAPAPPPAARFARPTPITSEQAHLQKVKMEAEQARQWAIKQSKYRVTA